MEFIEISKDRYLIKGSNGIIVSKKEMLKLKKKELIIKDITSDKCQAETTQKIEEINKELDGADTFEQTDKPI